VRTIKLCGTLEQKAKSLAEAFLFNECYLLKHPRSFSNRDFTIQIFGCHELSRKCKTVACYQLAARGSQRIFFSSTTCLFSLKSVFFFSNRSGIKILVVIKNYHKLEEIFVITPTLTTTIVL
jgi:hypothetical protein